MIQLQILYQLMKMEPHHVFMQAVQQYLMGTLVLMVFKAAYGIQVSLQCGGKDHGIVLIMEEQFAGSMRLSLN